MRCAVQFHIKPSKRKTWGEHSSDGWYLRTSQEHYRSHVVLVKATRAKHITDTVFFKHKFITQPTVTPADAIIKACQDPKRALLGQSNMKGKVQMDAIKKIELALEPTYESPIDPSAERQPKVELKQQNLTKTQSPRVEAAAPLPRVDQKEPQGPIKPRLVVASSAPSVVVSSPTPIRTRPKDIVTEPESSASLDADISGTIKSFE
jgi:hypothetical protein